MNKTDLPAGKGDIKTDCPVIPKLKTLEQVEEDYIRKVFGICQYEINITAKTLGIGRATLYRKLKEYNIPRRG